MKTTTEIETATALKSAVDYTRRAMAGVEAGWLRAISPSGEVRAARHGKVWLPMKSGGWRWRNLPRSWRTEPLADCPWYAEPSEAERRARGLAPRRYASEIA